MTLDQAVAIVTGSSSGIGEAIARRLSAAGCRVVVNSNSSVAAGERIAGELADAIYVQGDVSQPATATKLVNAAIEQWGRLDGLVNNAGRTVPVPMNDIASVQPEHWAAVMSTNVIGTFQLCQAALPHLQASADGWIVNIGSVAGIRQTGSSLPYAVSKAALHHLTTILAKFGEGVRVNAIAPGLIETPWTEEWEVQREFVASVTPQKRIGTADDIAAATMGVITSPYSNGAIHLVDGGLGVVV